MCADVWTTVAYVWLCGSVNACCDEMSSTHQRFPGDCVKRGYLMSQSTGVSLEYTENYLSALFSISYLISFHLIARNVNVKTKQSLSPLLPIESIMPVVQGRPSIEQTKERMTTGRCVAYLSVAVQLIGFRVLLFCLYGTGVIHGPCCLHTRGSSSSLSSFPTFPLSLTPDSKSICHLEVLC